MPNWRAYGQVMAMRQSSYGLHVVLHCRRMEFDGFHTRERLFLLTRCADAALCDRLEAVLRVRDLAHMAGVTATITRPQSPWLKRDWELIATAVRVPKLLNLWRRIWMQPCTPNAADVGD